MQHSPSVITINKNINNEESKLGIQTNKTLPPNTTSTHGPCYIHFICIRHYVSRILLYCILIQSSLKSKTDLITSA